MMHYRELVKKILPPIIYDPLYSFRKYTVFLEYKKLVSANIHLKNIHSGKRCFILGSGNSIKKENLDPLQKEIVFAQNNFYLYNSFKHIISGNIPKYYVLPPAHLPQTEEVYTNWLIDMDINIPAHVKMILGLNRDVPYNYKYIFEKNHLFKDHQKYWFYANRDYVKTKGFQENGIDMTKEMYRANAVSIFSIMIALYMGFDKIYLLGVDHDYILYDKESDMRFYKEAINQQDEFTKMFGPHFEVAEYIRQAYVFRMYLLLFENTDKQIINASDGGLLKIFPKVKFKDLF